MTSNLKSHWRLGTRASPLALAQATAVKAALLAHHELEDEAIEIVALTTSGDRQTDRPLAEIGGKALWTKELDQRLNLREIDFAVHSMKDVETIRPDNFVIAAMLARGDPRDKLLGATSLYKLAKNAVVGTSSPRRSAQLKAYRPDLQPQLLRGNVATRLKQFDAKSFDAVVLAAAGLERLGLGKRGRAIDINDMLPAAGQGAIGVECLADDFATRAFLYPVSDYETVVCVNAERYFLEGLNGGCQSPVAAYARLTEEGIITLRGEIICPTGEQRAFSLIHLEQGREELHRKACHEFAFDLLDGVKPEVRQLFG